MNSVTTADVKNKNTTSLAYVGWLTIALFYFYQYMMRVAPGVLITDLRQTFHLTAEEFATLGAFYLYAYSLCQIPLGIIVDYIGIRKTVITSILLCLSGTFLMANAETLGVLQISRVLVGIGSACAFMCSLKIVVDYLPIGKRGFLMGATLTLGTLGAITAGKPLASLADQVGWRPTVAYAACFGLAILSVTFLFLPRPRRELLVPVSRDMLQTVSRSLVDIFKTPAIITYSILAIGMYTPLSVLADLWGVAFLMQKYALTRTEAAEISMMMYVGLGLGCLILPWLSEKYHFLNRSIQVCAFGVFCVFALMLFGPALSPFTLKMTLMILGIFCGVEMLCFAGASRYTHARNVGTTFGVVNTLNMLGGGVLQHLIGWVLDKLWSGRVDGAGVRFYDTHEYTMALSVLFVVIALCCVMSLRLPRDARMN